MDGPGIRYAVFAQGCPHHCAGCHNPQTWSFESGFEADAGQIIGEMKKNPILKGLTISGGEPFCQGLPMAELARQAHKEGYDVITYTGFTFEELLEKAKTDEGVMALLEQTDILVDGPYIQEMKSYEFEVPGLFKSAGYICRAFDGMQFGEGCAIIFFVTHSQRITVRKQGNWK